MCKGIIKKILKKMGKVRRFMYQFSRLQSYSNRASAALRKDRQTAQEQKKEFRTHVYGLLIYVKGDNVI